MYKCQGLEEKSSLSSIGVKLYQGYDGWFFREGDMESMYELSPEALKSFQNVDRALSYEGIRLVLLPMLPRGIAAKSFIPNGGAFPDLLYDPDFSAQQFSGMVQSLRQAGIEAVDITKIREEHPEFDWDKYYLKRDIHWTPEGARIVAKAVANRIRELHPENDSAAKFETEATKERAAIRFNLTKALNEVCQEKIPPESVQVYKTKRVLDSLDSLLSEGTADTQELIHVVGTSFTDERMDFNFDGFLREDLEQEVAGFSIAGGGLTQSIHGWTQNAAGLAKKPKYLLWEYSDLQSVLQNSAYLNDTLVPAIIGDCTDELKVSEGKFDETDTVDIDLPLLEGDSAGHYLRYEFSNKALSRFLLTYRFDDGSAKKVSFENPSRVSGLNSLYQSLPSSTKAHPTHVTLRIHGGLTSAGQVKLCRYPSSVISPAATSN